MSQAIQTQNPQFSTKLATYLSESTSLEKVVEGDSSLDSIRLRLAATSAKMTIAEASAAPKVFQLAKANENGPVLAAALLIRSFADALKLKERLAGWEVAEIAYAWVEHASHNSIEDLTMCLKNARTGKYGKIYGRFAADVLFDFWNQYLDEQAAYRENEHLRRKDSGEKADNEVAHAMPQWMRDAWTKRIIPGEINAEYKRARLSIDKRRAKQQAYLNRKKK